MSLEDDLRHQNRNSEARQRSIEQLGPTVKECVMLIMEMDEEELREWRDDVKDRMRARRQRAERKNAGIIEIIKWVLGLGLGAVGTWVATHWTGQGGAPHP